MSGVAENLASIRDRIARACERAERDPASVKLIAVSKTKPVELIRAALGAGQIDFGENYAQELRDKAVELGEGPRWHFLGALQTNKVKYVAGRAALVHTVDRAPLAEEIAKRARAINCAQSILLEVNLAAEPQKGGVTPAQLLSLLAAVRALPELSCQGLMCIPPAGQDPRACFAKLRRLRDEHAAGPELSMGMSDDFEVAIEEGATLVRVGTAIFGARGPPAPQPG